MVRFFLLLFIFTPISAFAYLDPGTGNVIINIFVGGIVAIFFSIKGLFYYITKRKEEKDVSDEKVVKDIVLFSEGKIYWATFKPIIEALVANKVKFRYYTLDIEDPALTIENDFITPKFLGDGVFSLFRWYQIKADILLSTTPNIGTPGYPLKRHDSVKRLVHVFHSINDISAYEKGSLDHYDEVILVGNFQEKSIRQIEKTRDMPEKKLISLGLPYLDELVENKTEQNKTDETNTVLIGSSWGSKGCLQSYGTEFIKKIAFAGYHVIVRPHPQSLKTENHLLTKYKKELKNFSNVIWDETISPSPSMNSADILISDTSSIRFDFSFVYEKPVITLDIKSEEMPGYEREDLDEIWTDTASTEIGFVIERENIENIASYVERALTEFSNDKISVFRDSTVKNYGECGKHIAEYISK